MAIDINKPDDRSRLSRALRKSFSDAAPRRRVRENLVDIYRDKANHAFEHLSNDREDLGTLLNLFQKYVRGQQLTLAFYSPRWDIEARTVEGRGLDKRIQSFLTRYTEILNFNRIQRQLSLDTAFGWSVAKVDSGVAPKGITAPVAPRVYRINPDMLIVDQTAATLDECSFIGDMYLVPLNEARAHPGFNEVQRAKLTEYRQSSTAGSSFPDGLNVDEAFAEGMTRLVDVYIAKTGMIYTWEAPNDEFSMVAAEGELLGARPSPINPYCLLNLMETPGFLRELSRLESLRGLHLLANEMLHKGVEQARGSQRNPIGPLGSEEEMSTVLNAGDNNPVFADKEKLGIFNIPGPDASILNLGNYAANTFGSEGGNLEVSLGQSTGADTARQTEALIGQISASQSLDRRAFEQFLSEIGQKLATLAFHSEALEIQTRERIPGTKFEFSRLWVGPARMPRVAAIDSFHFNVVPFSTSFRTPQEKVSQLNAASDLMIKWMTAKGQGAPIRLEAVMESIGGAFDLVPQLAEWWSGEDPTPAERTSNTYTSLAQPSQGSDVRYQGAQQGGGGAPFSDAPQTGGVV